MESKEFKKLIDDYSEQLNLEKYNTAYFKESEDSIVFLILRKSGYSTKYYLRLKTQIKPFGVEFDKKEFIKHDVSDVILSLDSEAPELFDLERHFLDNERSKKLKQFFDKNVKNWIDIMLSKKSIINKFNQENMFLLPYTKSKLGLK